MKHITQLYAKASTNKIKVWRCDVTDTGCMIVTHGYLDGKLTTTSKQIKGVNAGKANATTNYTQAILEAESKMRKKMDEGYVADQKDLETQDLTLPMLAQTFGKSKHRIVYPAVVQPKLNGVRCMADYDPSYLSRKGKEVTTLSHLDQDVMALLGKIDVSAILDGETFNQEWNFQEIVRAFKKIRENSSELQYWIFDLAIKGIPFTTRYEMLKEGFIACQAKKLGEMYKYNNLVLVPCYKVENEDEVLFWHEEFKRGGMEGTIIRNTDAEYVFAHRTHNLQKHKDFQDEEFEIVGGEEATGDDAGTIVFICKTNSGATFRVRPKGTRSIRREWLTNINSLIGKPLTVRFQEKSEDGIPIFPVGLTVRDYE